jgi:hypothetical protein
MKRLLTRDVPPRAAVAVVALALVAGAVAGREEPSTASQGSSQAPAAAAATSPVGAAQGPNLPDLDLDRLSRTTNKEEIGNLFTPKTWTPATPAGTAVAAIKPAPPSPPPAPTAPALPFKYLGKLVDGGRYVVFIGKNDEHYSVSAGITLDENYKVESITDTSVNFIYTPLGTKQALPIPASPDN